MKILNHLLLNKEPYDHLDDYFGIIEKVKNGERPKLENTLDESLKNFFKSCWNQDPKKRPTFEKIIEILKSKKFRELMESNDEEINKYLGFFGEELDDDKNSTDDLLNLKILQYKINPLI